MGVLDVFDMLDVMLRVFERVPDRAGRRRRDPERRKGERRHRENQNYFFHVFKATEFSPAISQVFAT